MLTNKVLAQIGMIAPNRPMHDSFDQELRREAQYDSETLLRYCSYVVGRRSNSSFSSQAAVEPSN